VAQIVVQLYTTIGNRLLREKIPIKASNIAEAVYEVEKHFGKELQKELHNKDGSIKESYVISLNGYPVDKKEIKNIKVKEKDTVQIFPAISGG
jgi:molybdopterin converting factor small subunit